MKKSDLKMNKAMMLHQEGKFHEALKIYIKLLSLKKEDPHFHFLIGTSYLEVRDLQKAKFHLEKSNKLSVDNISTLNNLALAYVNLQEFEKAGSCYDRAIFLSPATAELHQNKGSMLLNQKNYTAAIECFENALRLRPVYHEASLNQGVAFSGIGSFNKAVESYNRALAIKPDYAEAYNNRGLALLELLELNRALEDFNSAIKINPNYAEAYFNRAKIYSEIRNFDEAAVNYKKAIEISGNYTAAYVNLGNVLKTMGFTEEASKYYEHALSISPDFIEAYVNYGNILSDQKKYKEAVDVLRKAFDLNPDFKFLIGKLMHQQMLICDWRDYDQLMDQILSKISKKEKSIDPLAFLGLVDSPILQKEVAEIYVKAEVPVLFDRTPQAFPEINDKIRIGYYSADFHDHATMHLIAEIIEKHDRESFEIHAFSFGPTTNDFWQRRARQIFDNFHECINMSDEQISELSRNFGINIGIDLKGFTRDARPGIFARRVAPIQVNFLGYPGTFSTDFFDYIIADMTLIPDNVNLFFSEKIAFMPHCYQPNCRIRDISSKGISRAGLGLPEESFVFCSFNSPWKITPEIFGSWMKILGKVPDSLMWIFVDNPQARENLIRKARDYAIDPDRLVFCEYLPTSDHLERLCFADLMLDTHPYGAHTTCSDALRVGLPLITIAGQSFSSRVAASLLNTIGVPELVTYSITDFEQLAVSLALDKEKLAMIKNRLRKGVNESALFDSDLYIRNLESLYRKMSNMSAEKNERANLFA